jgi:hypothetical protein
LYWRPDLEEIVPLAGFRRDEAVDSDIEMPSKQAIEQAR